MLSRPGYTLIELLVVLVILSILMGILLPAVQSTREAARRTSCQNHLKQIAAALLLHEDTAGHLPTGGWRYQWNPDPDRGFSEKQPGTWTYNILPYLEQRGLHRPGADGKPELITVQQKAAAAELAAATVAVYQCPSRGSAAVHRQRVSYHNARVVTRIGQGDYAACAGDRFMRSEVPLAVGMSIKWKAAGDTGGVCFQRGAVRVARIIDGLSNTYMVGEKFFSPSLYYTPSVAEEYGMWCYDWGNIRVASPTRTPWRDADPGLSGGAALGVFRFGSAHPGGWHAAFRDGSVHFLAYGLDPVLHSSLGNRRDGKPVQTTN